MVKNQISFGFCSSIRRNAKRQPPRGELWRQYGFRLPRSTPNDDATHRSTLVVPSCFTYDVSPQIGEKMMSDRKYRQRGYMESDREREQQPKQQPKPREREGPRSPRMMAFRGNVRCAACAATLESRITVDSRCAKCGAELHSCRQCTFFDPGARFECRKPITSRIVNKQLRNACELFQSRTIVERETSSGPMSASQAFQNLFKK